MTQVMIPSSALKMRSRIGAFPPIHSSWSSVVNTSHQAGAPPVGSTRVPLTVRALLIGFSRDDRTFTIVWRQSCASGRLSQMKEDILQAAALGFEAQNGNVGPRQG